jgi:hypothetical protein
MFISDKKFEEILHIIKKHSNADDLKMLVDDMSVAEERNIQLTTLLDYFPDGGHPNQECHLKLYQYLMDSKFIL